MEDYTKTILKNAVIKEQASQKMYKDLAKKAKIKPLKDLFMKLYEEEKIHENLFKKMDLSILKKVNRTELNNLNILKDVTQGKLMVSEEVINDIIKALDFAIIQEQKAYNDYMFFVKYMTLGEPRTALKEIAMQEARHKTMLQKVQLDFNEDDWV